MADYLLVSTVAPDREVAARLASSAVRERLAASAQVFGPVSSFFWHLGEQGEGEEWQVVLRTTGARYDELERHLLAEHVWDNPEVTAVSLAAGSAPYLRWLDASTNPAPSGEAGVGDGELWPTDDPSGEVGRPSRDHPDE